MSRLKIDLFAARKYADFLDCMVDIPHRRIFCTIRGQFPIKFFSRIVAEINCKSGAVLSTLNGQVLMKYTGAALSSFEKPGTTVEELCLPLQQLSISDMDEMKIDVESYVPKAVSMLYPIEKYNGVCICTTRKLYHNQIVMELEW